MTLMKSWATLVAGLLLFGAAQTVAAEDKPAKWQVIHAGVLLNDPGRPPLSEQSVIIRNNIIQEVRAGYLDPKAIDANAEVIDLRNRFVLPGLIDAHVHLGGQPGGIDGNPARMSLIERSEVSQSEAAITLTSWIYAKRTLEAGFTTLRDVGEPTKASAALTALRDAIDAGHIPGPRLIIARNAISVTGGHADIVGYSEEVHEGLIHRGICDGADACRKAVRDQVARGATAIKIMASGGGGTPMGRPDSEPEMTSEEMVAAVETAHALGMKVAAHAHGDKAVLAAVKAGVDSIEHAAYGSRETFKEMAKRQVYLVPTMAVRARRLQMAAMQPEEARKKTEADVAIILENFKTALKVGVPIAFGTDAGVVPHGSNGVEFAWYVKLGMSPMEAIRTSTHNAAVLLGVDDKVGVIDAGKLADIIAVDRSPLQDITALEAPSFVMKDGMIYKNMR